MQKFEHIPQFEHIPEDELRDNFFMHTLPFKPTQRGWAEDVINTLNTEGFATFQGVHGPEGLLAMAALLGTVRRYQLTDDAGVTTMATGNTLQKSRGTVVNPQGEQPLHTDGSTMANPPDIGIVYCAKADPGPRARANVFASGKGLYEGLRQEDPGLWEELHRPVECGDVKSGIFTEHPDGKVSVRLRPVDPVMAYEPVVLAAVDERLRQPDLLTGITIGEGEGYILNNTTIFHGVGPALGPGRVAMRVILDVNPELGFSRGFMPDPTRTM